MDTLWIFNMKCLQLFFIKKDAIVKYRGELYDAMTIKIKFIKLREIDIKFVRYVFLISRILVIWGAPACFCFSQLSGHRLLSNWYMMQNLYNTYEHT